MVFFCKYMHKLVTLAGVSLLLPLTSQAVDLMPVIPKAKGQQCVESTDKMRRNHMEYILHQRNDTLRKGIRTPKYSLKKCIECHNAPDKDNRVAHISSKQDHFCSSCHTYVAVKIDCFECHADKPKKTQYHPTSREGH